MIRIRIETINGAYRIIEGTYSKVHSELEAAFNRWAAMGYKFRPVGNDTHHIGVYLDSELIVNVTREE